MITPLAGRRWGPVLLTCAAWLFMGAFAAAAQEPAKIWTVPEVGALPDNEQGRLVRRGRDLITATYAHIGPEVPALADRYAGNNLACGNCHLRPEPKSSGLPCLGCTENTRVTTRAPARKSPLRVASTAACCEA